MILLASIATFFAGLLSLAVVLANGMRSSPGPFRGMPTIVFFWGMALVLWLAFAVDRANAASLDIPLPPEITMGYSYDRPIGLFGTYSTHYMQRRWARMCKGPMRYEAMREAFELGRPNPCR